MKSLDRISTVRVVILTLAGILFGALATMSLTASASSIDGAHSRTVQPGHPAPSSASLVTESNCEGPIVAGGSYAGCSLEGHTFRGLDLTGASFDGAKLDAAIFDDVNLTNASFVDASLRGTRFNLATFNSVDFTGSSLDPALITMSHGDGLSKGVTPLGLPAALSVVATSNLLDLSTFLVHSGDLRATPLGSRCTIPLDAGGGFVSNPVHLSNCPEQALQWGWATVFKETFPLDGIPIMNLSRREATGLLTVRLTDGLGRSGLVDLQVSVGTITNFTTGSAGEFWVR